MAGALVLVCILTCHSAKSVNEDDKSKWLKGQLKQQGHARAGKYAG